MNKQIRDIQKPKPKHVDVKDQTKSVHIDIHNDPAVEKTSPQKIDSKNPITSFFKNLFQKKETNPQKSQEEEVQKKYTTETPIEKEKIVEKNVSEIKEHDEKNIDDISVVFMGTGSFAGNILNEILLHEKCKLKMIVTQPDKKIGRKKSSIHRTLAPNPVRDIAQKSEVELFQPYKIDDESIAKIGKMRPDILIVASYGKILPKKLLDAPKHGAINVHASLLPKLRGASPVQNALLSGLKETGVTIMLMDEGLDTGDILSQESLKVEDHVKSEELQKQLSTLGGKLLVTTVPRYIQGDVAPQKQNDSHATMCQLIDREDGHIQWTQTTQEIYNKYRALFPWPGIFSYWEETENQMMRIKLRAVNPYFSELTEEQKEMQPGTVFIGRDQLCVKTFDSAIIIEAVQPECKAVMPVYDFLNGHKSFEGAILR